MPNIRLVSFILRAGLGVVFLFAAIDAFLSPEIWKSYIPEYFIPRDSSLADIFLILFSVFQIGLAFWVWSGWRLRESSIVATLTLSAIIIANITQLQIVFRDIAILALAIALYVIGSNRE